MLKEESQRKLKLDEERQRAGAEERKAFWKC